MKSIFTVVLICLPILIFGQKNDLRSNHKTTQIVFSDINYEQNSAQQIRPYSVGLSIFGSPSYSHFFPSVDFDVNLWRNNRFMVGLNSQFFPFTDIAIGAYGGVRFSSNTLLKIEVSQTLTNYFGLIGEINLRNNFGSKKQFYGELGVSVFPSYSDLALYLHAGMGYNF